VQWASPHNTIDYAAMEHGSDTQKGATWEPDECVPDGLDVLRVRAKQKWLEQEQKNRLQRERDEAMKQAKAKRPGQEAGVEEEIRPTKQARQFNPAGLEKLFKDIFQSSISHGVRQGPTSTAEVEIKMGWPKKQDDYPIGYSAAEPPGCCDTCDCMEDWHLGQVPDPGKGWLANHNRDRTVERILEPLIHSNMARRRGTVTNRHYLEPNAGLSVLRPSADTDSALWQASQGMQRALDQAAQSLPLAAFKDRRGATLLPALGLSSGQVIAANPFEEHAGAHGPYAPSQYRLAKGHPTWLSLRPSSGEFSVVQDEMPALMPRKVSGICVNLMVPDDPKAFQTMKVSVDTQAQPNGSGALEAPTREVIKALQLVPPSHRGLIEARLAPIYDFPSRQAKQVHAGTWIKAVSDANLMLTSAATSHIMPPPGAGGAS